MAGHGIKGMGVEHVRSSSVFHHGGQKLLDHLDKFTLLRALDLEDCEGVTNDHMRYICRLYLLKFLSLKGTRISNVPPRIGKLEHLQTLDVRDMSMDGLPEAVKKLYKLERVLISYNSRPEFMWRLPLGLKKMKALREVGCAVLENDVEVARDVGELEQLEEIIVYLSNKIDNEEVREELAKSLSKSYSLRRLFIGAMGHEKGALNFLHRLPTPPRLLRYLKIFGDINGGLPAWVGSLTYLVEFNMWFGYLVGDQLYNVLCELPSLKTIVIGQNCYMDYELVARSNHRFPELSNLRVACDYGTPNVLRFDKGSMANLETPLFSFADKEKKIIGIEHLTSLKEVHLCGGKNNPALGRAVEQLKDENTRRRLESINQFQIVVKDW